jgi:hypothetical protein
MAVGVIIHGLNPLSDLWLLTLVAYEKWLLSLQKIDLKKEK